MGYDNRFAFAIPIYGSGYLNESLAQMWGFFKQPNADIWRAENRFSNVSMPILWLCWNDDCCFSIGSNSKSYLHTAPNNPKTRLSMVHNMHHSHNAGMKPNEAYWFADCIIKNKEIPQVGAEYSNQLVEYFCTEKVKSVKLFYIDEKMCYIHRNKYKFDNCFMKQDWQIIELSVSDNIAQLPSNCVGCYVEFTLENDVVLTTPYVEK